MKRNLRYPLKHLSVRVPWHDNAWNGTVCTDPKSNSACLILKSCALKRNDEKEQALGGQSIKNFSEDDFPVCIKESGAMMAPFEIYKEVSHPYVESARETHGHLRPTNLRFPPYSACTIPYNWMLKKNCKEYADRFDLDYDEAREPELSWIKGDDKGWVQEFENQKALLNCFYEHFETDASLVIFYAKQVPFMESSGRVIVGVGRIKKIIPSDKYAGSNSRFAAAYWEHMVLHSVRPDMEDGFLLPYHAALEFSESNTSFDPSDLTVFAPDDKWDEFSYAAEHVSNDSVIRVLLECQKAWEKAAELGIGEHHSKAIKWIHNELQRIQKLRGLYPGMGAALCAFGLEKGHFVAAEIINRLADEKANPWRLFEKSLDDPSGILSGPVARLITDNPKRLYRKYVDSDSPRLKLLHLLSRFDLSIDQAKRMFVEEERFKLGCELTDAEILANPYVIYEVNSRQWDPVALETIDLGLFVKNAPDDLLPVGVGSSDPLNSHRIRALTHQELHTAKFLGHTLLPRSLLISNIREKAIEPKCGINSDYFDLAEEVFSEVIERVSMKNEDVAYQLAELSKCRSIIRKKVEARISAAPLAVADNWENLFDARLRKQKTNADPNRESRARVEKLAALRQLGTSRFSVLIGPAGTGKTTLLTALASHPDIKKNGVLLLAPTGKARVRMEEMARDLNVTAKTLAQYLNAKGRFDGQLQLYRFSDQKDENYETVILDEASMLTEEMLATTLDCLEKAKRFILVGDHRQLPPIGAGRPFVDIVTRIRPDEIEHQFPRVGPNYSELSVNMRTSGTLPEDLQLAEWFSGNPLDVSADQVINDVVSGKMNDRLAVKTWKRPDDFEELFASTIVEELKLRELANVADFNKSLGSADGCYFNNTNEAKYRNLIPSVEKVEEWQVLSPVRDRKHGVTNMNRQIHQWFRSDTVRDALIGRRYEGYEYPIRKIPKPVGPEQIVYGDKVINLSNHSRINVYPQDGSLRYIANGEIGLVTGQFKTKRAKYKGQPQFVEVEFSSQKGFVYTFRDWDFKEESDQPLELAYALTVHKSQGSEFGTVILVIPNPCFILSREMLYTALTRQKNRVVLLVQGDGFDIKEFSSQRYSDTARRFTNLFRDPDPIDVDGVFLEKNLIHQASDGQMVRSKSELLIYQRLLDKGFQPSYEKKLVFNEVEKLPDFTIDDPDTGETYYWEHCGMMHEPKYAERWESKRVWYSENGILPWDEGGGPNGKLIITEDKPITLSDGSMRGAISVKEIDDLISSAFGL